MHPRKLVLEELEARNLLTATLPALGAIRWDAWWNGNPYQQNLAPSQYQNRLPFYSTGYGTSNVTVVGDSQAVMDQEIAYAKNSGLSYWAFDWYYPTTFPGADQYNYGITKYLSSTHKSDLNFCLLLQGDELGAAANWSTTADTLVNFMKEPTYQKVLGNRPLVYIYSVDQLAVTFGSDAAAKTAMDTLRTKAVAAGLGSPYIAAQVWNPTDGVNAINNDGLNAISAYAVVPYENGSVQEFPHSELLNADVQFWNQITATGKDVIPTLTSGWDNRPRWPNNTNGAQPGPYFTTATATNIQNDVTTALNWVQANAPADQANAILTYAWNENDEGGWLVPTIADGTSRLDALHQALLGFQPQTKPIAVKNASFEAPKTSSWYVVPSGGMDSSFGWSTGASPGTYLLATSATGQFTRAADGQQALLLSAAGSAWEDAGTAQPNTAYTVSFSLLTGKPTSDPQGTLTAKVFVGPTLIGSQNFTTPASRNTWQSFSLTATTGSSVTGDLTIMFTSTGGMPWLDNVALKTKIVKAGSTTLMSGTSAATTSETPSPASLSEIAMLLTSADISPLATSAPLSAEAVQPASVSSRTPSPAVSNPLAPANAVFLRVGPGVTLSSYSTPLLVADVELGQLDETTSFSI